MYPSRVAFRSAPPSPHFPIGGPVPSDDIVGRESFVRSLASRLGEGNHLLLTGPRRIGKTSIALEALRRLGRKGVITGYVDCQGATDLAGLGEKLADAALAPLTGSERSVAQARALTAGERPIGRVRLDALEPALLVAREGTA